MIEHESHSHAHHTGISWLDLIIAGSAIFISIVSLIISIHHGRTMEKLVAANGETSRGFYRNQLQYCSGHEPQERPLRKLEQYDCERRGVNTQQPC